MTERACDLCGASVPRPGTRGPWPKRCESCHATRNFGTCIDCGIEVRRTPGGRLAKRCRPCDRERELAKRRADLAAERAADGPAYQRRKQQARDKYQAIRSDPAALAERNRKSREAYKKRTLDPAWVAATGRRTRDKRLRKLYGEDFGIEVYDALLAAQGGVCAICRTVPDHTFHVDHCHTRGTVRGILCGPCNTGLGQFKDDEVRMRAAIRYLRKSA